MLDAFTKTSNQLVTKFKSLNKTHEQREKYERYDATDASENHAKIFTNKKMVNLDENIGEKMMKHVDNQVGSTERPINHVSKRYLMQQEFGF